MISVVVPSYNEEDNVLDCAKALSEVLSEEEYELIFVDDGSRDLTWQKISEMSAGNAHIKGLRFSRNFGKESAIRAGLEHALGDAAVVIDCDLQHPPEVIPKMIEKWRMGADAVEGKKSYRGRESASHRLSAKLFNGIMSSATGCDMSGASDFILLSRHALDAVLEYGEEGSFFRALAQFVGFSHDTVTYEVKPRQKGSGKFTLKKLIAYALKNIASFSSMPLYISLILGIITVISSMILGILKLFGINLHSITLGIIILMIIGGMILCCLSVVGFYISRIYDEVKARPKYLISEKTGGINDVR